MSWNENDDEVKTMSPNNGGFDISEDPTGGGEEKQVVLGRIDQYEILKELGTGGFGSVYLARDTVSRTFVAVKGLPALVKNNAEEMERIQENFALVSRLHHPNIAAALVLHPANRVSYSDPTAAEKLNVKSGNTLMVMEYAPGVTLTKWRRQFNDRKVPLDKAIEIVRQVASAMDYAHQRKIIHRDIKPSNVMVETLADGTFTARVLDFGLAAEVRSSMNRVSKEVSSKSGTRQYMAPEQWSGKKQGAATDQYSLAVLFYELVTGEIPFASAFECDDPIVMLTAVTTQEPEIPNDLPKKVQAALGRGLGKERESRFATCADFVAALDGKKVAKPGGTRSRAPALVGVAAALALAAGGVWWWHGREATGTGGTNGTGGTPAVVSSVPEVPPVPKVQVAPPASPVDEEAERRRLELKAETAVYSLSVEMESASRLIAGESEEVRTFFAPEIRAFENMRRAGNDAKANRSYVTATNFFAQAKAKADALKELVTARANCLAAKERAEAAKRSADVVSAKSALALRYEEADKALGQVASLAEKRDFAAASARAEAARSQFASLRADVIKVALDEAGRHKTAERWEQCLVAAEKVLGWEPQNAKAAALKREAESHLKPSLRFVAKIGEREVPATAMFDGKPYASPWVWDRDVRDGRRIPSSDVAVEYAEGGKRYVGTMKPVTVDWKGPKTVAVALAEYKGPKPGDTKTITLPGGATMEMVWCPPGSFMMGSPASENGRCNDETQHKVTLTKGFWMGKYEVTQSQWESVMGSNPSNFKGANRPVEQVSWDDCQEFIRKVNAAGRVQVSLPTEAQWEYACRAGTETPFSFGSTLNGDKANCDGNYPYGTSGKGPYAGHTKPIGSYKPNDWGLYDMHGNVWEWCSDWKGDYTSDATDPTGPASGADRVLRGGSWGISARYCRSAYRCRIEPGLRNINLGLRLVCSAGPRR